MWKCAFAPIVLISIGKNVYFCMIWCTQIEKIVWAEVVSIEKSAFNIVRGTWAQRGTSVVTRFAVSTMLRIKISLLNVAYVQ